MESTGTQMIYKVDQQLLCRCTKRASEACLHKRGFADDVILMARTMEAAAVALSVDVTSVLARKLKRGCKYQAHL